MYRGLAFAAFCMASMPPVLALPPDPQGAPRIIAMGFIGDSITSGERVSRAPPDVVASLLTNASTVVFSFNRGRSGTSTWDWLPGHGLLEMAKRSFSLHHVHRVHIALGTNDAKRQIETSPKQYAANLAAIAKDLQSAGFDPVVSAPPALLAKSPCGDFAKESPWLVRAYAQASEASPFAGRSVARSFSIVDSDATLLSRDQIHPTQEGSNTLASVWAESLK